MSYEGVQYSVQIAHDTLLWLLMEARWYAEHHCKHYVEVVRGEPIILPFPWEKD